MSSSVLRCALAALSMSLLTIGCNHSTAAGADDLMANSTTQPLSDDKGVAIVELFSSEGCSSCPPAEELLGKLNDNAKKSGRPIYTLAFHVDYWNSLGWVDPFSEKVFSQRQSDYATALGLRQVYTPQMIVNGQTEFVGSNQTAAKQAIESALAEAAPVKVRLKVIKAKDGTSLVNCDITGGDGEGLVLNVAVVEQGLTSDVKRGENAGQLLHDPSVVRWFDTRDLPGDGKADVALPELKNVKPDQASVIVFVQKKSTRAVLGAAAVRLSSK